MNESYCVFRFKRAAMPMPFIFPRGFQSAEVKVLLNFLRQITHDQAQLLKTTLLEPLEPLSLEDLCKRVKIAIPEFNFHLKRVNDSEQKVVYASLILGTLAKQCTKLLDFSPSPITTFFVGPVQIRCCGIVHSTADQIETYSEEIQSGYSQAIKKELLPNATTLSEYGIAELWDLEDVVEIPFNEEDSTLPKAPQGKHASHSFRLETLDYTFEGANVMWDNAKQNPAHVGAMLHWISISQTWTEELGRKIAGVCVDSLEMAFRIQSHLKSNPEIRTLNVIIGLDHLAQLSWALQNLKDAEIAAYRILSRFYPSETAKEIIESFKK